MMDLACLGAAVLALSGTGLYLCAQIISLQAQLRRVSYDLALTQQANQNLADRVKLLERDFRLL